MVSILSKQTPEPLNYFNFFGHRQGPAGPGGTGCGCPVPARPAPACTCRVCATGKRACFFLFRGYLCQPAGCTVLRPALFAWTKLFLK